MKIWTDKNYPIIISCAKGLSCWTEIEVRDMGYKPIEVTENTVVVRGAMRDVMRLNLWLRTAHRVLVPLLRTTCRNIKDLYQAVSSIDWENLLEADGYFSVSSIVHNFTIRDTRIPSLYTKDAIADRMREKCQRRPDSGGENIGAAVFVYWEYDEAIIYLDTSGEPLSKRGYRKIPGSAPMQETLTAACVMALGWKGTTPLLSPMSGSGTPAIEAAMLAIRPPVNDAMGRPSRCMMSSTDCPIAITLFIVCTYLLFSPRLFLPRYPPWWRIAYISLVNPVDFIVPTTRTSPITVISMVEVVGVSPSGHTSSAAPVQSITSAA